MVALDQLLLGGENGLSAADYAGRTGDLMRASTPISRWPHVELLRHHQPEGIGLDGAWFEESAYLANARACIALTGHYFGATDDAGVREVATGFLGRARGAAAPPRPSQSRPGEPPRVRPVRRSRCFEVVDGHHRLAAAHARGETRAEVAVEWRRVWTPLQALLLEMSWLEGRFELYQPIDAPELQEGWALVRRCTDRRDAMLRFLSERQLAGPGATYLDVASCYGWFVAEMGRAGFDALGMERDPLGATVAEKVYGLEPGRVEVGDCVDLLAALDGPVDVVSCFSLLHHFVLGKGSCPPERLADLLDRATGRVLFLDTGQAHEEWMRERLPEWDADHVEAWLRRSTTFDEVVRLGVDADGVGPFAGNYGRTLFACIRHPRGAETRLM